MNIQKKYMAASLCVSTFMTLAFAALPVAAQTVSAGITTSVGVSASGTLPTKAQAKADLKAKAQAQLQTQAISKGIARADQEITRRMSALNKLSTRVQSMNRVSSTEKANISTEVQGQITALTTLKTKIDADTDVTVLKNDIKTITGSYRIFALVIPRGNLLAASDRVNTIVDEFTTVSAKLQARITTAQGQGKDVATLQTTLTQINAKIADAKVQAVNAQTGVGSLTPDQGNQAQADSNKTALVQARADIKLATEDIKTARQDVDTILKALKGLGAHTTVTASSSISASGTAATH